MNLHTAILTTLQTFQDQAVLTKRETWQALDVRHKPEMATFEIIAPCVVADLAGRSLDYYQSQIKPDLPWADDHFLERVSEIPYNPPPSEAYWPHAPQGNSVFKKDGLFSHTYPERLWPKTIHPIGIRYPPGDLLDVVSLLSKQPYTRQAYVPIWYPEDTGDVTNERKPCTLGYHFMLTDHRFDVFYYIRSCDLLRHFRNDVYMTVRLLLWMLETLHKTPPWPDVQPGTLRMYISSLHIFRNDWHTLFGEHR